MRETAKRLLNFGRRLLLNIEQGYVSPEHTFPARDVEEAFEVSRGIRYQPKTLLGKTKLTAIELPDAVNHVVGGSPGDMKKLRPQVQQIYEQSRHGAQVIPKPAFVDAYNSALFPQMFVSALYALTETRRRLGSSWRPRRVLDIGTGPATGIVALNEIFQASETWAPQQVECVVVGDMQMARRGLELLAYQKQNHWPGLPDDAPGNRRFKPKILLKHLPSEYSEKFDLIIASQQLLLQNEKGPAKSDRKVKELLSLLEPNGVLVLIERGSPLGFDRIARARELILRPPGDRLTTFPEQFVERYAQRPETTDKNFTKNGFRIVAPCSHHLHCPMQAGKKELDTRSHFCSFPQLLLRPKWLIDLKKGKRLSMAWSASGMSQKSGAILGGSGRVGQRNSELTRTSYLVVQREADENVLHPSVEDNDGDLVDSLHWPRMIRQPLKRDNHVILELCTPNGFLERWTVNRAASSPNFHDARKAHWGDLWAFDAKTKMPVKVMITAKSAPQAEQPFDEDDDDDDDDDDDYEDEKVLQRKKEAYYRKIYQV
ncbi:hypothetical protein V1512DRAFT_221721 [Lipomyces arxii]|uniref:uncharacterized protein n=1 Tax=Lipomyces arxii TaxID=56418 RepID=UPI0034CF95B9